MFEEWRSSTYRLLSNEEYESSYISGTVSGYLFTDSLCYSASKCVPNMQMLGITNMGGMQLSTNGLIGFSPIPYDGDLFVDKLYEYNQIESKVFSFSIGA